MVTCIRDFYDLEKSLLPHCSRVHTRFSQNPNLRFHCEHFQGGYNSLKTKYLLKILLKQIDTHSLPIRLALWMQSPEQLRQILEVWLNQVKNSDLETHVLTREVKPVYFYI